MKIAVLGCGPAGLLAAHAAVTTGHTVTIYSEPKPSKIGGAQFLHQAIPGITQQEPDGEVNFVFVGTPEIYARKVYGDPLAPTSWLAYTPGLHPVWNMQQAYDNLWERYKDHIVPCHIAQDTLGDITKAHHLTFSCVPAPAVCPHRNHDGSPTCEFKSQPVWIEENPPMLPYDMTIIYSGFSDDDWYRTSNMFGHAFCEYSFEKAGAIRVVKPLATTCEGDPWVIRLGRYGKWRKAELIHDAYNEAMEICCAL